MTNPVSVCEFPRRKGCDCYFCRKSSLAGTGDSALLPQDVSVGSRPSEDVTDPGRSDAVPASCECGHPKEAHGPAEWPRGESRCLATIYQNVPNGMNAWPCKCREFKEKALRG